MELVDHIYKDYEAHCKTRIAKELGVGVDDIKEPVYDYQRLLFRQIPVMPRIILEPEGFEAPESIKERYSLLIDDIRGGANLKKYQSRGLKSIEKNDNLLSHWGIHHLHMSQELDNDGFVARPRKDPLSNYLLFVRFDTENAYILGLYSHGDWNKQELIKTIHTNWPDSIAHMRANIERCTVTDSDIKILRAKNANTNIYMDDGICYMPLGGGVVANGDPIANIVNVSKLIHTFRWAYNQISEQLPDILDEANISNPPQTITVGAIFGDEAPMFFLKELKLGILLQ